MRFAQSILYFRNPNTSVTLLKVCPSAAPDEDGVTSEGHSLISSDVRHTSICVSRGLSHG